MRSAVAVFGGEGRFGVEVAAGLTDLGHPVALLSSGDVAGAAIRCNPVSATDVAAALRDAAQAVGPLRAVVDATPAGAAGSPAPLVGMDAADWVDRAEAPLRHALHRMQGVHQCLRQDGGRVVVVLPSLALSGAAGLVAWATAAEGRRAFVKLAARAWGADGVTVNCVLVPGDLMAETGTGVLDRPGLPPAALGRRPAVRTDVARAISGVLSDDLGALTGQTLAVDGGVWMTP